MTPLDINFRPSFAWQRTGLWAAICVLALGSSVAAWKGWSVSADAAAISNQSAAVGATLKSLELQQRVARARPPYFDALAELLRMSSFPMGDALDALENIDAPGTRVIDLKIDNAERRAFVVVEATSPTALRAFLEGLAVDGPNGRWRLQLVSLSGASFDGMVDRPVPQPELPPSTQISGGLSDRKGGMLGQNEAGPLTRSPDLPTTGIRATLVWHAVGESAQP